MMRLDVTMIVYYTPLSPSKPQQADTLSSHACKHCPSISNGGRHRQFMA